MGGHIIPKRGKDMEGTRLSKDDRHDATLLFGWGQRTLDLSLDLDTAVMDSESVEFSNDELEITISGKRPGIVGKLFYDLFDNLE